MSLYNFFNDTETPEIYTLSLHDALPISPSTSKDSSSGKVRTTGSSTPSRHGSSRVRHPRHRLRTRELRSEEHTSELQSRPHLVGRLLLGKKNQKELIKIERDNAQQIVEI